MAYNYFPVNYGYQPSYIPQYSTQQTTQNQSGMLWVSNEQEAYSYPVAPNNAVALWDSSKASVYIKQADASGKPTIKIYDLSERTQTPSVSVEKNDSKYTDFAQKSDIEALTASIEAIKTDVRNLKKEITKKTVKRSVEEDDDE